MTRTIYLIGWEPGDGLGVVLSGLEFLGASDTEDGAAHLARSLESVLEDPTGQNRELSFFPYRIRKVDDAELSEEVNSFFEEFAQKIRAAYLVDEATVDDLRACDLVLGLLDQAELAMHKVDANDAEGAMRACATLGALALRVYRIARANEREAARHATKEPEKG